MKSKKHRKPKNLNQSDDNGYGMTLFISQHYRTISIKHGWGFSFPINVSGAKKIHKYLGAAINYLEQIK